MELYIIAGPNGVGKTTFARKFLPKYANCRDFINADLIAQGIAPFSPEAAAIRAGRLMLSEIRRFAQRRVSFGFETTLSGRSYLRLIERLRATAYKVHLLFLFVDGVEVAPSIKERVSKGGPDVPEPVVRRRFDWSISNFIADYQPCVDSRYLFENTGTKPIAIAFKKGHRLRIIDRQTYQDLIGRYGER